VVIIIVVIVVVIELPFLVSVAGDNKPIWMHAEEKEENKVVIHPYFHVGIFSIL